MEIWQLSLVNLGALVGVFTLLWVASIILADASIIDPMWGLGFVVVAWLSYGLSDPHTIRTLILAVMVTVWGLRLTGYLLWRNWGKAEDYRYAAMRDKHGGRFPLVSLATVFWLQAGLAWLISWPLQAAMAEGPSWQLWNWLGVALWAAGLFFESVGDYQLARFKADPNSAGKVMDRGLWRYTRHPNYFGDFLVWWGFYLVSATPSNWWWTIVGPTLMTVLLLRVSGVSLLESSLRSRVGGYEDYVRRTSSFVPLPPRKS